ncbi:Clavaminate synthase-like protein At3g21360 [Linum perenne]
MKDKYPELVMKLEEEGLLFIRVMADEDDPSIALGRGWKSTFSTHDTIFFFFFFFGIDSSDGDIEIANTRKKENQVPTQAVMSTSMTPGRLFRVIRAT